jgi:hypothetical protein
VIAIRSAVVLLAIALVAVAGTRLLILTFAGDGTIATTPCVEAYSEDRCDLIAAYAAKTIQVDRGRIASVAIVPEPTLPDGRAPTLGGATPIRLRITMQDGSTDEIAICGGAVDDPACRPILR